MCAPISTAELSDQVYLGRLLTRLEQSPQLSSEILAQLPQPPADSQRIGVTGSPGVGKSTMLSGLIKELRAAGHRIGVVAVDPTSPLTGGALLGDRMRLADNLDDPDVFIRSLGSRGSLGGVSPAASTAAAVLEAAGYDRILIETVGVGQTGYDVVCLADTVVAVFSPEAGDGVQLLKAGILEVGDIFAVNKSDRPGAENMLKEIRISLELGSTTASEQLHHGGTKLTHAAEQNSPTDSPAAWTPPVHSLIARDGTGISELIASCEGHRKWLTALPTEHPRRRARLRRELGFVLRSRVSELVDGALSGLVDELAAQVQTGKLQLSDALSRLRDELRKRM